MEKIRLTQDTLTPGQLKQRNGEVELYSLGQPMEWADLLTMPADLRKEYLVKLRDEYKATQKMIAHMFGIGVSTLRRYCNKWGLDFPKTGGHLSKKDRQRWAEFTGENIQETPAPEAEKAPEPAAAERPYIAPITGSMDFDGPACDALRTMEELLRDTHVFLTITWTKEGAE